MMYSCILLEYIIESILAHSKMYIDISNIFIKVYQNSANHDVQRYDIFECVDLEMQCKLQNWKKPTLYNVIAMHQSKFT